MVMAWLAVCGLCQPVFGQSAFGGKVTVLSATDNKPVTTAVVVFTAIGSPEKNNTLTIPTGLNGEAQNPYKGKTAIFIYAIGFDKIIDTLSAGQSLTYHTQPLSVKLNDVIVTGQYGDNTADKSVYKVRVIDDSQIKAQGAVNLRDVLANQLNIRLSQDAILGSSLSLQGVGGENIKILIDGVPMVGRQNGNIDLSQINLNNIERIEIVEGPLSVSYGTNALGGAINLITKKEQLNTAEFRASTYYETVGQYNADGRIGINKGKHSLQFSGGRNFFDGFALVDTSRFKTWKPKEQYFGNIGYGYRFKALTLRYSGEYFWELITNRGQRRAPYYETAFDDYYRTQRINNSVTLNGKVAKYNINVIAAYNTFIRHKNTYFKNLVDLTEELTTNSGDQDTSRFDLFMSRATISTSKQRREGKKALCNFEAGYDLNVESAFGQRIDGQLQNIGDYAAFVSAEYSPVQKLILRPGVRFAYNTAYKAPIIPSINILFTNNKGISIRASYARGFRAPSIKELYFNFVDINHNIVGSEDLKAEYSNNFSANFTWRKEVKNTVVKTDISGFYNQIDNLITLVQTDPFAAAYTYGNIGKYKTVGGTAQVDYWIGKFKFGTGFNYVGRTSVAAQDEKLTFYFSPEVRATAAFIAEKAGVNVSIFYKYTGKVQNFLRSAEGDILQNFIGDYNTLDVTASKTLWKRHITLTIGGKNLMNVQNVQANIAGSIHGGGASNSAPIAWGRTFFVKLDFNFWK